MGEKIKQNLSIQLKFICFIIYTYAFVNNLLFNEFKRRQTQLKN